MILVNTHETSTVRAFKRCLSVIWYNTNCNLPVYNILTRLENVAMKITTISDIITHKVLNENTGELENKDFREVKAFSTIRGGYSRMYKSYDEALLLAVKSAKDLEIILSIRDMFTYKQVEISCSAAFLAEKSGISRQKASTLLKRLTTVHLLHKVRTNVYRLNPFMYLPFRTDAESLQTEWNELVGRKDKGRLHGE